MNWKVIGKKILNKMLWLTRSNALERSTNKILTIFLELSADLYSYSANFSKAKVVDLPALLPNWLQSMTFLK
jgi:hypothetical protein